MAVFDEKVLDQLLKNSSLDEIMALVGPEVNAFISGAAKPKGAATGLLKTLVNRIMTGEEKRGLKALTIEGAQEAIRTKVDAAQQKQVLSGVQNLETIAAKGEQTRANLEKRAELQQATAVAKKELDAPVPPKAPVGVRSRASSARKELNRIIDSGNIPADLSGGRIGNLLTIVEQDPAQGPASKAILEQSLAAQQASNQAKSLRTLQEVAPDLAALPEAKSLIEQETLQRGRALKGRQIQELVGPQAQAQAARAQLLSEAGVVLGEGGKILETGSNIPLIGKSGTTAAEELLARSASALETGQLKKSTPFVEQAIAGLKKSRGKAGLLAGGAGALLLSLLASRGGKSEPDPIRAIQQSQLQADLQNRNSLSQSIIGSRNASAAANQAQADLRRFELLQRIGGQQGGGGIPQLS